MRLAILIIAAASAAASPAAADQMSVRALATGSVPVSPLAPEEVLLELEVTGTSQTRGDAATILIPVTRMGVTPSEARAALESETARIVAAARKAGVAAGDVQVYPVWDVRVGFIGNASVDLPVIDDSARRAPRYSETASIGIRLRDPSIYPRVRDAVESPETTVPQPVFILTDRAVALREARADAMRKLRVEAEDYAREVGMRVGRVVRITAASNPEHEAMDALMIMMGRQPRDPAIIQTTVTVSAGFALVPNR